MISLGSSTDFIAAPVLALESCLGRKGEGTIVSARHQEASDLNSISPTHERWGRRRRWRDDFRVKSSTNWSGRSR